MLIICIHILNLQVEKFPTIIEDTPLIRLWFKKDDEFLVPKARMIFDFVRYAVILNIIFLYNHVTEKMYIIRKYVT